MFKFQAIKPVPLNKAAALAEMKAGIKRCEEQFRKDYEGTTKQWKHPVEFEIKTTWSQSGAGLLDPGWPFRLQITVYTLDKVWNILNAGIDHSYPIPKNGPFTGPNKAMLQFRSNGRGSYVPKTTPGSMISGRGGGGSGAIVYRRQVIHPGIKARKWDETEARKREKWFVTEMQGAIWKALKAGGYVR